MQKEQDILREKIKLAKAQNDWLFYKDIAPYLGINVKSFYNWLYNKYNLGYNHTRTLKILLDDLLDD